LIQRGLELCGRYVGPVRRPVLLLTPEVDRLVEEAVAKLKF